MADQEEPIPGTTHPESYEDVRVYGLDEADEQALLLAHNECTFIWSTKDGWPVGVIMSYVFRDGKFWLTASEQRLRIAAIRRDPRVSMVVDFLDSPRRVIIEVDPVTRIGYDGVKMGKATASWIAERAKGTNG